MTAEVPLSGQRAISQLRERVTGRVITRADDGYDRARAVVFGGTDHRPAAVVQVADTADVARVIETAREAELPLAVRSGGHSSARHGTVADGLVLDVRNLRSLEIDAQRRTAWAQTGMTAGAYTAATGAHGLTTGFGDMGSVGIGGIALAGGVGYLVRKHGLTIDNMLAADVVTASGELIRCDAEHHPDLFWAIRGGGGNFGVVTSIKFQLQEVDEIVGGMMLLPATANNIVTFMAEAAAAPEELSTIANIMPAPPMPFVAPEHHGKLVILALVAYAGDAEAGNRALAPFRAMAPLNDMVKPMRYPELFQGGGEGEGEDEFHPTAVGHTMFLNEVDTAMAESIIERVEASDAAMRAVQLRALGGAMARVPRDATAFAHRQSPIMGNVASFYQGEEDKARRQTWVDETVAKLFQGDTGAYVGFMADEGVDRVKAAYPEPTWQRLAAAKALYDPANLFQLNQNVPPAG